MPTLALVGPELAEWMELHLDTLNLQLKDLGNELDLDRELMGSRLNPDMDQRATSSQTAACGDHRCKNHPFERSP